MSWWDRKRGDDQPGAIKRAIRFIYERPERLQPVDDRRETAYTMDLQSGEVWPAGDPRPDEEQWIELGELGPGIDYSRARGRRPLRDFLWRR
jgi:hypothetical protein